MQLNVRMISIWGWSSHGISFSKALWIVVCLSLHCPTYRPVGTPFFYNNLAIRICHNVLDDECFQQLILGVDSRAAGSTHDWATVLRNCNPTMNDTRSSRLGKPGLAMSLSWKKWWKFPWGFSFASSKVLFSKWLRMMTDWNQSRSQISGRYVKKFVIDILVLDQYSP